MIKFNDKIHLKIWTHDDPFIIIILVLQSKCILAVWKYKHVGGETTAKNENENENYILWSRVK